MTMAYYAVEHYAEESADAMVFTATLKGILPLSVVSNVLGLTTYDVCMVLSPFIQHQVTVYPAKLTDFALL